MLKIRMQRTGRINMPTYRIVVAEHTTSAKSGKFVERLGSYNPKSKERILANDRITYWLSVGAKPSGTMHNMLVSAGLLNAKKLNVLPKKTVPAKEAPAEETAVAKEVPAAPAETQTVETSAEEAASEAAAEETPADEQTTA